MDKAQTQIYEFGDFRLDPSKRLLIKGDDELLPLTPKVFDTLLYLVRNSGKVISKDELMREIWRDTVVEENNLSQNISNLRRILGEKPGEGRFIATVPGRGFRFVPEVREGPNEIAAATGGISDDRKDLTIGDERNDAAVSDVETEMPASKSNTDVRKSRRWRSALAAGLIILALASLGFYLWRENTKPTGDSPIKTVAILPFKPLVVENRDEALEIGMADTLISRLEDNREVVVRPLSSVRRFGDPEQDAVAAGRELEVEAVLDGSIQRWGDDIRINARLIRVADGSLLWTGTFDEKFAGIFAVQDAISSRVVAALSLTLGSSNNIRPVKLPTENVEAYQHYLRGRYHVFKLTPQEIQIGISYFQRAVAIDANYALAYAGLADAYRSLALGTEMPPTEFLTRAKTAAAKAVEIDETLSEAHAALAMTIFWGEWNWSEAENQFKRALELNPNSSNARLFYAHLLSNLGRHPEALAEIKICRNLDPLFPFAAALEGQFLFYAGQNDEALEKLMKASELEPSFWMPHLIASGVYIEKGMYEDAVKEARLARKLSPVQTTSVAYEGYALAKLGRRDEARAVLDELMQLSNERFVPPINIALIYNGLGERDEALAWLERGFEQRDPRMAFLKINPKLNDLRPDPRFKSLMQRMNLPQ